jgi:hypothetical protein
VGEFVGEKEWESGMKRVNETRFLHRRKWSPEFGDESTPRPGARRHENRVAGPVQNIDQLEDYMFTERPHLQK